MSAPPRVSVVVPFYNEAEGLGTFLAELRGVLDRLPGGPHEIVAVDDGSTDRTLALLEEMAVEDPRLVVVSLSRNFGHQAAICAGLDHSRGDAVVVMDGDGQDRPADTLRLLAEHAKGNDVVYAVRVGRKEGLLLRASYFLFYRLLAALAEPRLPLDAGDFAVLSRRVVEALARAPERHRYLRGLRTWVGFRQVGIPVERAERRAGAPKYTLARSMRLAFDGVFAFSVVPLRAAALLGAAAIATSSVFAAYWLVAKLFLAQQPRGFTALVMMIIFLSGIQLLFLGIIGEYVGRVYEETKGRPLYLVGKVVRRE